MGPQRLLFGRMYEDVAIESSVFAGRPRIFCIASAGCTAMHLAKNHQVTAVDINQVQLQYAQARAAGAAMQVGTAERIMRLGRRLMLLAGWRKSILEKFLDLDNPAEQTRFWWKHLNTRRFRYALDAMLGKHALHLAYAAPFLQSLPPQFGFVMRARLERCWATHSNRSNLYARSLLGAAALESSSRTEACQPIRFVCTDAVRFLERCAPGSFDGFTLSNICDGASNTFRARLFAALKHAGTRNSIAIIRSFAEPDIQIEHNLAKMDRSMIWGMVDVLHVGTL